MFGFLTDHESWDSGIGETDWTSWILNNTIYRNALEFCSVSADPVNFFIVGMELGGSFRWTMGKENFVHRKISLVSQ